MNKFGRIKSMLFFFLTLSLIIVITIMLEYFYCSGSW